MTSPQHWHVWRERAGSIRRVGGWFHTEHAARTWIATRACGHATFWVQPAGEEPRPPSSTPDQ